MKYLSHVMDEVEVMITRNDVGFRDETLDHGHMAMTPYRADVSPVMVLVISQGIVPRNVVGVVTVGKRGE